jgi:Zn-dependent protease
MPVEAALILFELVMMVFAISLHDCAQAWAANRLGDPSGRMLGRISMNPAKHFDLFGMAIWPLIYVWMTPLILGWGKPVPMTFRNFRKKNGEILATLAGPLAQVGAAVVCLVIVVVLKHTVPGARESLTTAVLLALRAPVPTEGLPPIFPALLLLNICIYVSLLLAVFNLVPVPFLDGGKILAHFLPYNAAKAYEQYGLWIMIGFFFLGIPFMMVFFQPLLGLFQRLMLSL